MTCVPNRIFEEECVASTIRAMQAGYSITVQRADGATIVKDVLPKKGAVILEPDIHAYFPDSESVKRTLRCLIPLLPPKLRARAKKNLRREWNRLRHSPRTLSVRRHRFECLSAQYVASG